MTTTPAAVLLGPGQDWTVTEVDLRDPGPGEVLVRWEYAGLCQSDYHVRFETEGTFPIVGGHEGSGVVEAVGAGVVGFVEGDHVVSSFLPSCGRCRWCASGRSYLCDLMATITTGQLPDGSYPFTRDGQELGGYCLLGTFARRSVVVPASLVRIEPDVPLDVACLVSCGVLTGWGSVLYGGRVAPGEAVIVVGTGGVGVNALQAASQAGAAAVVAVDPNPAKRDFALGYGATDAFATVTEAVDHLASRTGGLADVVVLAVGNLDEKTVTEGFHALDKGGRLVLAGLANKSDAVNVVLPGNLVTALNKTITGAFSGGANPKVDVPRLLALQRAGKLELASLVSATYPLADVNRGYDDLIAGRNIRGLLAHGDVR